MESSFKEVDEKIHLFVQQDGTLSNEGWAFVSSSVKGIVTAVLRKQNVNSSKIDELFQDSLSSLISTDWRQIDSPVYFILKVINNKRIDFIRKEKVRKEVSLDLIGETPFELWEDSDRFAVFHAIGELPNPEKVVMALKFQLGWNVREIADALGISKSSVSNISIRAIEKIRKTLQ
jgi:RNA polymerase sigma factor (sigma-70 family)